MTSLKPSSTPPLSFGHLLVTANARLARYHQQQAASDVTNHLTGNICHVFSYSQLIEFFWQEALDLGLFKQPKAIASPIQIDVIWNQCINEVKTDSLISVNQIENMAAQAHDLKIQWGVTDQENYFNKDEISFFDELHTLFLKKLSAFALTTPALAVDHLIELVNASKLPKFKRITWHGFIELSPQQQRFFDCLGQPDSIKTDDGDRPTSESVLHQYDTREQELWDIAHKVKAAITHDPHRRIGIIVPDLAQTRAHVNRVFLAVFNHSDHARYPGYDANQIFDISSGEQLDQTTLIHGVVQLWQQLHKQGQDFNVTPLLSNPYWQHLFKESKVDALYTEQYTLHDLACTLHFIDDDWQPHVQALINETKAQKKTVAQWREFLVANLEDLGWLQNIAVNTLEYQTVQSFIQALRQLDSLAPLINHKPIRFLTWLSLCIRLLRKTIFQPQVHNPKVFIVGLLESVGLPFDESYLIGADSRFFPASPRINPLLEREQQITLRTPKCDYAKEIEYSENLLTHLIEHSQTLTLSYAHYDEQGKKLAFAPLIEGYSALQLELQNRAESHQDWYSHLLHAHPVPNAHLKQVEEVDAHSLHSPSLLPGGTQHLKQFLAHPLYAYLLFRCQIKSPENYSEGLPAHVKGNVIHLALQEIWQGLQTQAKLAEAMACETFSQQVQLTVKTVLMAQNWAKNWPEKKAAMYIHSLSKTIQAGLALDLQRPNFKVDKLEHATAYQHNSITINMRIDRIDTPLDDPPGERSEKIVIDYKTGDISLKSIYETPLKEPQLALYSLSVPATHSVALLKMTRYGAEYLGVSQENQGYLTSLETLNYNDIQDWTTLESHWQTCIHPAIDAIKLGALTSDTPARAPFYDELFSLFVNCTK